MNNSKVYYSVSCCQEHGYVEGKIRIRKTEEELYFAVKKLKMVGETQAEEVREKRDALRSKRNSRKQKFS